MYAFSFNDKASIKKSFDGSFKDSLLRQRANLYAACIALRKKNIEGYDYKGTGTNRSDLDGVANQASTLTSLLSFSLRISRLFNASDTQDTMSTPLSPLC